MQYALNMHYILALVYMFSVFQGIRNIDIKTFE